MARWALVAGPSTAAPTVQLTQARDVKVTLKLAEPSSLSFTIDGRHPQAFGLIELGTDVHLLLDGEPVFTGRIGSTQDTLSDVEHTIAVTVADTRALLGRRLVQAARTYTNTDAAQVARDLIIDAQVGAGAGLGITIPDAGARAGITVTREVADGAKVLDELQAISGHSNDAAASVFDWDITPGWAGRAFQFWAPQRGSNRGVVLDYTFDPISPRTSVVTDLRRTFDPKDYANVVHVSGGTHTETRTENQTVTETRFRTVPVKASTGTGAAVTSPNGSATTVTRGTRTVTSSDSGRTLHIGTGTGNDSSGLTDVGFVSQPRIIDNPSTESGNYTREAYTVTYTTQVQVEVEVPNAPRTYDDGLTAWQLGVWATAESYPDVTTQAELDDTGRRRLAELSKVAPGYTLGLRDGWWQGPGHVWLGDTVRLLVNSGRLHEDVELRVQQLDLTLGNDGEQQLSLTVGTPPSLLSTILEQQRRIATLERQASR